MGRVTAVAWPPQAELAVALAEAADRSPPFPGVGPLPDPEGCTATAGGHTANLSIEQAENASIIAAVAERRGLPARRAGPRGPVRVGNAE